MVETRGTQERRPSNKIVASRANEAEKVARKAAQLDRVNAQNMKKQKLAERHRRAQKADQENREPYQRQSEQSAAPPQDVAFTFNAPSGLAPSKKLVARHSVVPPAPNHAAKTAPQVLPRPAAEKISSVVPAAAAAPQHPAKPNRLSSEQAAALINLPKPIEPRDLFEPHELDEIYGRPYELPELSDPDYPDGLFGAQDVNAWYDQLEFPSSPEASWNADDNLGGTATPEAPQNADDNPGRAATLEAPSSPKRPRSQSLDSASEHPRKVQKIATAQGRTKAAHYELEVRELLKIAFRHYRLFLTSKNPFPEPAEEIRWAKVAWKEACRAEGVVIAHDAEILKLITSCGTHLRGKIKSKTKDLVASLYKFQVTSKPAQLAKQRGRVADLKSDFAYVYRKPGLDQKPKAGFLRSSLIQDVISRVWFKHAKAKPDAVALKDSYKPFPRSGIALVMAAIECSLDEWSSGTLNQVKFYASNYREVHQNALIMLNKFHEETCEHKIMPKIQEDLFAAGCVYAKVEGNEGIQPALGLSAQAVHAAIEEFRDGYNWEGDEEDD